MTNLKQVEFNENNLKRGFKFIFSNERWQTEIGNDDIRNAEVEFSNHPSMGHHFKIWFNGTVIHTCKSFKSLSKRLEILKQDWHLDFTEINE